MEIAYLVTFFMTNSFMCIVNTTRSARILPYYYKIITLFFYRSLVTGNN